jgi:Ca2+-binding EF-hand superfamily protein
LFDLYDSDADETLSLNELCVLLEDIGNKITALPAVCLCFDPNFNGTSETDFFTI